MYGLFNKCCSKSTTRTKDIALRAKTLSLKTHQTLENREMLITSMPIWGKRSLARTRETQFMVEPEEN